VGIADRDTTQHANLSLVVTNGHCGDVPDQELTGPRLDNLDAPSS
jgi:hypothetical protein